MILPQEHLSGDVERTPDRVPLDFPPAIDPIFWGTGDLLMWEADTLLKLIDKEKVLAPHCTGTVNTEAVYTAAFDALSSGKVLAPRGFYGFFPVITEKEAIVVLDPSDFHTELLSFFCPPVKKLAGRSLADFYRPEGDVLAISAVTLGTGIDRLGAGTGADSGMVNVQKEMAREILRILNNKMTVEVRRGLGIDGAAGTSVDLIEGLVDLAPVGRLVEVCGFEERLAIAFTDNQTLTPLFSNIWIVAHHPEINNFVYFGT